MVVELLHTLLLTWLSEVQILVVMTRFLLGTRVNPALNGYLASAGENKEFVVSEYNTLVESFLSEIGCPTYCKV